MKLFHPLKQLLSPVVMNHSTPLHLIITPWFAVNIWTITVDSVRLINPPRAPRSQESNTLITIRRRFISFPVAWQQILWCVPFRVIETPRLYIFSNRKVKSLKEGTSNLTNVLDTEELFSRLGLYFSLEKITELPEMPDAIAISLLQSATTNVATWLGLILEALQTFSLPY